MRKFTENELVLATHNAGKVREISDLLRPYVGTFYSAGDLDLPEPEETETTFEGNAVLKARAAAIVSGKPALADDSGLAVNALNGAPGIYSARWAYAPDSDMRDFNYAMNRINNELSDNPDRTAAFICALALVWPDGHAEVFSGRVDGILIKVPRGSKGFGYDPMFVPNGHSVTFAEMDPAEKHAMSHRADAFKKMVAEIF